MRRSEEWEFGTREQAWHAPPPTMVEFDKLQGDIPQPAVDIQGMEPECSAEDTAAKVAVDRRSQVERNWNPIEQENAPPRPPALVPREMSTTVSEETRHCKLNFFLSLLDPGDAALAPAHHTAGI